MSLRLRLHETGADQVAFGCSPAHEALRSLEVLADVKHHPLHISWALRARKRMSPALKAEADAFAFWYRRRPLLFRGIWPHIDVWDWADELSALRRAPVAEYAEMLIMAALVHGTLGPRVPLEPFLESSELQREALTQVEARHPASLPVIRELIVDPERSRQRFADFLAAYWEACVAPEWPRIEALLQHDIARRGRALYRRGLLETLEELSPDLRVSHESGEAVIWRRGGMRDADPIDLTLAEHDQLLLAPSYFIWPRLTAVAQKSVDEGEEGTAVLVVYPLTEMQHEGQAPVPPEQLLKLLRAAGDPTRLQVLQLIAQRPRSTREIAGLIGLTEAAISKHLKLLQEAGWVAPERRSYYVFYRLHRDSVPSLSRGLEQMLALSG
jgi:DNA-binding transcriptional ArsR family regulator